MNEWDEFSDPVGADDDWDSVSSLEGAEQAPKGGLRDRLAAAGTGVVDALTLGFADEIAAAPQSLIQGRPYSEVLAERDAKTRQLYGDYPVTSTVAGLAGGVAGGGLGGAAVLGSNAVRAMAPLARGAVAAGVGALEGGIAGAGYSQPGDRTAGAVGGALLGGGIGAAIPAIGSVLRNPIERIKAALSPQAAQDIATSHIAKFAQRDKIDPRDLAAVVAGKGDEAMPVDAGTNLASLGEYIAGRSGEGKAIAEKALATRSAGQQPRIVSAMRKAAGMADDAAEIKADPAAMARLEESLSGVADISGKADRLKEILNRPSMRQSWEKARVLAGEEGEAMPSVKRALEQIEKGEIGELPVRWLHYVKKGLDDVLEPKRDPITGAVVASTGKNQLQAQKRTRAEFRAMIKELSPSYGVALDEAGDSLRAREAYQLGQRAFSTNAEKVSRQVKRFSGKELEAYRQGFIEAVDAGTAKASDQGLDVSRRLVDDAKMNAIFGDKAEDVIKALDSERAMRGVANRITGGSQTAGRQQVAADIEGGGNILNNPPSGMVDALFRIARAISGESKPPEAALTEASKILFSNNPQLIEQALLRNKNISRPVGFRPQDYTSLALGAGASQNPMVIEQRSR